MSTTLPVRRLVEALTETELTAGELAERLQYPLDKTLGFLSQARAAGHPVVAVPHPGEGTRYVVRARTTNATLPLTESPTMEDNGPR